MSQVLVPEPILYDCSSIHGGVFCSVSFRVSRSDDEAPRSILLKKISIFILVRDPTVTAPQSCARPRPQSTLHAQRSPSCFLASIQHCPRYNCRIFTSTHALAYGSLPSSCPNAHYFHTSQGHTTPSIAILTAFLQRAAA